ncbi:MAG: aminoglycoside phosphotransferase family protein [Nitrospirota bacterium]
MHALATDPQFPHLSAALEPALMKELLQHTLLPRRGDHKQEFVVESCFIGEKRYKPGKSCVLSYQLHLHDASTGASHEQVLSARLCKSGKGMQEFHQARLQNLSLAPKLQPLAYLPEMEMVVWTFPNDRKLTHLSQLLDTQYLESHLPPKLAAMGLGEFCEIAMIKTEVLHYLPERSCIIRYTVTARRRPTVEFCTVILYGKTHRDNSGAETYSVMRQLTEQMPGCAIPLGYDQELRTVWQSHIPGEPLRWETLHAPHALEAIKGVARCVAEFHQCTVQTLHRFDLRAIDECLIETIEVAEHACPALAGRIKSLVSALLSRRKSMQWATTWTTPIHRDLKISNFLIDGERVSLIDMDCVCIGDPLIDIASLIASTHLNGILGRCDRDGIGKVVEVLCSTYAEATARAISWPHLNWYTAAALLHEITRRSIRQLDTERLKRIADYLDLTEMYASA